MSILDRYLSSGKGKSVEALRDKTKFQLAAITSFYMAVKLHEPVKLGIDTLITLCRGFYTASDITSLEQDVLTSLDWRVYMSTTTPMEYVRQFLELIPEVTNVRAYIIQKKAMKYMDCATEDIAFSFSNVSVVGIACLAGALDDTCVLSVSEKGALWRQLSKKLDFDIASNEIRKVERQLIAKSKHHEPRRESRGSTPRSKANVANERLSSPVSVMQMA
mmetsp:Transcript_12200/g.21150  ORF Transcript_12200/g.21150 Transcript_12200/m.21150 type:complete len:219 (+) Transcript_12200:312-968(+)